MTLTMVDLDEIEKIVGEKVDEKTRNLPTKKDFFEKMDEVVGELKAIREEQPLISQKLSEHSDRIEKIEEKLQIKPAFV